MARKYLLITFLILPLFGIAQNNGCIDSITLNQFSPSNFEIPVNVGAGAFFIPQRDTIDNLYISGGTSSGFNNNYWSILKFDTDNKLLWYKNYKIDLFATFRGGGNLWGIEPNCNLLFYAPILSPINSNSNATLISKTDSAGNFLWSRTIKNATNPDVTGGIGIPCISDDGNVYMTGRYFDNQQEPVVAALDAGGSLMWSKSYKHITVPKYHFLSSTITTISNNALILVVQYFYNADVVTDPAAKLGFQFIKINTGDGSIDLQKSFMYYSDATSNIPFRSNLQKINYDADAKRFLMYSNFGSGGHNYIFSLFDENIEHVKTAIFTKPSSGGFQKVSINKSNNIHITIDNQGPIQSFRYAVIDNQLNLGLQKYVDLAGAGFPNRNFSVDLSYKKNGMLSFQLGTYTTILQDYFFIYDQTPYYNKPNSCVPTDSLVYSEILVYTNPVANPLMEESGTIPLTITNNFPDFPFVEFPFPKTLICKQTSICDTLKLLGTQYHCMSNPLDSFKIYKNPQCIRKTSWEVDTNYISILSQNDTALYVRYKQSYRGKIRVSFGGCSLKDSLDIEVYNAQPAINLGNDTMHCPGKTIILHAGKNYKTYLWQDGSARDSLVATQPGNYNILAVDSCGNVFKDTIIIAPFDVTLTTDYPNRLCPKDTATFTLPNNLYNYSWSPTINSSLSGFTWRLFPSITTTYSITGERMPGCTVSDTVLVRVRSTCQPEYIYFPTAFSPDANSTNDIYKPSINGDLAVYEFMVYNRYGQLMFRTTDPTNGWNGTFNNYKPLLGGYVWSCKYQFQGKMIQHEQGTFMLIR